ncbi:DUF4286 family protein [Nocardia vinacea]|uniref:EthD domain-containing protein n=1 Tax=Nocardia vinacea TaxID=96468 RepID=A0ABZ1YW49_9NOCA|nr:DUF4286 family protein [Nocardia vinacea]
MKLMVFSRPQPGRDEEYNTWYGEVHVPEMLAIDGVKSCTRHRLRTTEDQPTEYLAVYDIDGDIDTVMKELMARSKDGRMRLSSSIDPANTRMTIWEPI